MAMSYRSEFERYKRYYLSLEDIAKKPMYRSYTAAIFSFLAISLFAWYAILPTLRTILFLRREIVDSEKVNKQMEEKIVSLIEAQETYQAVEPKLTLLSQALPDTPEAVSLVSQLRNLTVISQASVSSIQAGSHAVTKPKSKKDNEQNTLTVSIILAGPYESLQSFLSGLALLRRTVTIESMKLNPTQATDGNTSLQLVVNLITYYTGK